MFLILNADWVQNAWRSIMFFIDLGIYLLISGAYGLINELAGIAVLSDRVFVNFTQRIYIIIGLFILFKTGLALLNMLLNPDNFYDSKTGGKQLVKKIVVALTLLILIPTIFSNLFRFQYLILNEGILPSLILGSSDNSNSIVDTGESAGNVIAGITFRAFFTPNLPKNNDGSINYGNPNAERTYTNPNSSIFEFQPLINLTSGNQYVFRYSTIVSSIAGGLAAFLMITFAFEIALRSVKLAFLQLIAPVPIILSIDPKKGDALKAWVSEVTTTFVDLFMRLSLIYFAVFLIAEIFGGGIIPTVYRYNELGIAESGPVSPLGAIFIIFGILMFVKIAPKLIYSMVGMKEPSGGLGLSPWKKLMGIPLAGKLAGATASGIDAKMHGKRFNSGFKKGWDAVPTMGGTNTLKSLRSERTKALEARDKKKDLDYDRKRGAEFVRERDKRSLGNEGRTSEIEAQMIKDMMKETNAPLDSKTLANIKTKAKAQANLEQERAFIKDVIFKGDETLSKAYDEVETMKTIKRGAESNYETLVKKIQSGAIPSEMIGKQEEARTKYEMLNKRIQSGESSPELIEQVKAAKSNYDATVKQNQEYKSTLISEAEEARKALTSASVNLERAKSNYEIELNYNPSVASDMKAYEGAKADAKLFDAMNKSSEKSEPVKVKITESSSSEGGSKQQPKSESAFGKKENKTYLDEKAEKEIAANKAYIENNFEKPDMSRYDIADRYDMPKKDDIDIID